MLSTGELIEKLLTMWNEATGIWLSGGWAMIAIAVIALFMFAMGMHVHLNLKKKGFQAVSEKKWRKWIERPEKRKGPVGKLLDYVTGAKTMKETKRRFGELNATETEGIERDLRVMKICVSAAPLVGLLGTVTGMLDTFGALASGSGGEKTMGLVAKGISEALVTTETGLVIALPGLFFQYQLTRRCQRYKAFLAKIESVCTQVLYPRFHMYEKLVARSAAKRRAATALRRAHKAGMRDSTRDGIRVVEQAVAAAGAAGTGSWDAKLEMKAVAKPAEGMDKGYTNDAGLPSAS